MKTILAAVIFGATLFLLTPGNAPAQNSGPLEKGLEAFHAGNHEEARRAFTEALRQHGPAARLYFNQGLALQQGGDTGGAVLAYLRALVLEPSMPQAREALAELAAEKNLTLPVGGPADELIRRAGAGTVWTLGAVLGWIGVLAAGAAFFRARQRGLCITLAVVCLGVSGAFLGLALVGDPLLSGRTLGVVQGGEALPLRANPVEAAGAVTRVPPGTIMEILSERSPWAYVEIPGGKKGWLPMAGVASVVPGSEPGAGEG